MVEQVSVLFCNCCYYDLVDEGKKSKVLGALRDASVAFYAVGDLCGLAAGKDELLKELAANKGLKIIACYERGVRWLFSVAGAELGSDVEIYNLRTSSADEVIDAVINGDVVKGGEQGSLEKDGDWAGWFPVIDFDRCVDCKQCLNFCLFGVYQDDDAGRVAVANPANCKRNCPACARVCPEAAIIFAKYDKSPINGDEVLAEHLEEQGMQAKMSDRLQGNVYDMLRQRSAGRKRFSTEGSNEERIERLKDMQKQLDIPADVIAGLTPGKQEPEAEKKEFNCQNAKWCDQACNKNGGNCDK